MSSFEELAIEFLSQPKIARHGPRWHTRSHPFYATASMPIAAQRSRLLTGRVVLTAHRIVLPAKYCFSIVFRSERILGLDVNPARCHRNLLNPASIHCTHWQRWPTMEAEPDAREQTFSAWLHEFLARANVSGRFLVRYPPRGVQLELSPWRRP